MQRLEHCHCVCVSALQTTSTIREWISLRNSLVACDLIVKTFTHHLLFLGMVTSLIDLFIWLHWLSYRSARSPWHSWLLRCFLALSLPLSGLFIPGLTLHSLFPFRLGFQVCSSKKGTPKRHTRHTIPMNQRQHRKYTKRWIQIGSATHRVPHCHGIRSPLRSCMWPWPRSQTESGICISLFPYKIWLSVLCF